MDFTNGVSGDKIVEQFERRNHISMNGPLEVQVQILFNEAIMDTMSLNESSFH